MPVPIDAIYENGVFIPMHPPSLPDHTRVRLVVELRDSVADKTAGLVVFSGTLAEYLHLAQTSEETSIQPS